MRHLALIILTIVLFVQVTMLAYSATRLSVHLPIVRKIGTPLSATSTHSATDVTATPTFTSLPTVTITPTSTAIVTNTVTPMVTPIPMPTAMFESSSQAVVESAGQVTVTVYLNRTSPQDILIPYTVAGTANNPNDYTLANGSILIPSGTTTTRFAFSIISDALDEPDESIIITLGSAPGVSLGTPSIHTVIIIDDDPPSVQFSQANYSIIEDDVVAVITVTLSSPSDQAVSVLFTPSDGTAICGSDYNEAMRVFVFGPGMTTGTLVIIVKEDPDYEGDETVNLSLSNSFNASLGVPSNAVLTIVDDDPVTTVDRSGIQRIGKTAKARLARECY